MSLLLNVHCGKQHGFDTKSTKKQQGEETDYEKYIIIAYHWNKPGRAENGKPEVPVSLDNL